MTCEDMPWECDDQGNWLDNQHLHPNPVAGMYQTGYGYGDVHAIDRETGTVYVHPGIDVYGTENDEGEVIIIAVASGRIYFLPYQERGFGNYAILMVPDGEGGFYGCLYAHMRDDNTYGLQNGQVVGTGTPIGVIGTTGNSTGNHLHYEVRHDPGLLFTYWGFDSWTSDLQGLSLYYPPSTVLPLYWVDPGRFQYIYIPSQPEVPCQGQGPC